MENPTHRLRFVIDGSAFDDREGFYAYMSRLLAEDPAFRCGRKLDALNDLLRGGFGAYGYGQPVEFCWTDFARSRALLGEEVCARIAEVIRDTDDSGHDCTLITED